MKHTEFDARYRQLLRDLDQLTNILEKHGEVHWAASISKDRLGVETHDPKAMERLLAAFGGMGNFNDLMLHPNNGHTIKEEEIAEVEERLGDLGSHIWAAAKYLKQALGKRQLHI